MERRNNRSGGLFSKEVFGMALVLFSVLAFLCLIIGDIVYPIGSYVRGFLLGVLGYYSFIFLILTTFLGASMVFDRPLFEPQTKSFLFVANLLIIVVFAMCHVALFMKGSLTLTDRLNQAFGDCMLNLENSTAGGAVFSLITYPLLQFLRPFGTYAVLAVVGILCIVFFVNRFLGKSKEKKGERVVKPQPVKQNLSQQPISQTQNNSNQTIAQQVEEFDEGATMPQKSQLFIYGEQPVKDRGRKPKKRQEQTQPSPVSFPFSRGGYAPVDNDELLSTRSYASRYEQDFSDKLDYIKTPQKPDINNIGQTPMSTLNSSAERMVSHRSDSSPYSQGETRRDVYQVPSQRHVGGGWETDSYHSPVTVGGVRGGETVGDIRSGQGGINPLGSIFDRDRMPESSESSTVRPIERNPYGDVTRSGQTRITPTGNDRFMDADFTGKDKLLGEDKVSSGRVVENTDPTPYDAVSKVYTPKETTAIPKVVDSPMGVDRSAVVGRTIDKNEERVQEPKIKPVKAEKPVVERVVKNGLIEGDESIQRVAEVAEPVKPSRVREGISAITPPKTTVEDNAPTISSPIFEEPPKPKKPVQEEKEKPNPIDLMPLNYRYKAPPLSLLNDYKRDEVALAEDMAKQKDRAEKIVTTFKMTRNIDVQVDDIIYGPTVTRFVVSYPPNVSSKNIQQAQTDLQVWLEATGEIRLLIPIPGTNKIGIEVPNAKTTMVGLKSVIAPKNNPIKPKSLSFSLGQDIIGTPINLNILSMPHLIVAGATGTGKSVCLNSMLISLLYRYSPEDLRLIIVDPKMVEFNCYKGLPHLMFNEIIFNDTKAMAMLDWAVQEMERRYLLFVDHNSRNIGEYNEKVGVFEGVDKKLPYIVILVDEFADLMMMNPNNKKKLENCMGRLAQKARAAGIHLIFATQRPSADVMDGTIKNNFTSRICFKTSSNVDSQVVIGQPGAERLLGNGDVFFKTTEMSNIERAQGSFISDAEVRAVTDYIRDHNKAYYDEKALELINKANELSSVSQSDGEYKGGGESDDDGEIEDVYLRALRVVILTRNCSKSSLQSKLGVGYPKAVKILDWMVDMGYISDVLDNKQRTIYITREIYEENYGEFVESWK